MRMTALVLAAALLAATPAIAQTEPTTPPAETAQEAPETPAATAEAAPTTAEAPAEEELICRTVQRTESRLRSRRERVCGTRAQWETMQNEAARGVRAAGSVQGQRD